MSSNRGIDAWICLPCNVEDPLGLKSSGRSDDEETGMIHTGCV